MTKGGTIDLAFYCEKQINQYARTARTQLWSSALTWLYIPKVEELRWNSKASLLPYSEEHQKQDVLPTPLYGKAVPPAFVNFVLRDRR